MISLYKKININNKPLYAMPAGLKWRKELQGINYQGLHLIDIVSLVYSLRIDNALEYLRQKGQERMRERGITEITPATEEDFDEL